MGRQAALCGACTADIVFRVRSAPADWDAISMQSMIPLSFLMLASVYYRIEVVRQAKLWVHCLQRLSQTGSSLALGSYVVCPAPRRWLGARPKMKTRCGAYCGKVTPLQLQHQRTAYSVWPPMVCQKDQSYC